MFENSLYTAGSTLFCSLLPQRGRFVTVAEHHIYVHNMKTAYPVLCEIKRELSTKNIFESFVVKQLRPHVNTDSITQNIIVLL